MNMFCPNCGKELSLNEKFCLFCGNPVPEIPKQKAATVPVPTHTCYIISEHSEVQEFHTQDEFEEVLEAFYREAVQLFTDTTQQRVYCHPSEKDSFLIMVPTEDREGVILGSRIALTLASYDKKAWFICSEPEMRLIVEQGTPYFLADYRVRGCLKVTLSNFQEVFDYLERTELFKIVQPPKCSIWKPATESSLSMVTWDEFLAQYAEAPSRKDNSLTRARQSLVSTLQAVCNLKAKMMAEQTEKKPIEAQSSFVKRYDWVAAEITQYQQDKKEKVEKIAQGEVVKNTATAYYKKDAQTCQLIVEERLAALERRVGEAGNQSRYNAEKKSVFQELRDGVTLTQLVEILTALVDKKVIFPYEMKIASGYSYNCNMVTMTPEERAEKDKKQIAFYLSKCTDETELEEIYNQLAENNILPANQKQVYLDLTIPIIRLKCNPNTETNAQGKPNEQVCDANQTSGFRVGAHKLPLSKRIYTQNQTLAPFFTTIAEIEKTFSERYQVEMKKSENIFEGFCTLTSNCINRLVEFATKTLAKHNLKCNAADYIEINMEKYFNISDYYQTMFEKYWAVMEESENAEAMRQLKAMGRSQWMGGGRTIGSALAGALLSKGLNATRSFVADSFGKARINSRTERALQEIFTSDTARDAIEAEMSTFYFGVFRSCVSILRDHGINLDVMDDISQADHVFNQASHFDKEEKIGAVLHAIEIFPYNYKYYDALFELVSDSPAQIEEVAAVARFFGRISAVWSFYEKFHKEQFALLHRMPENNTDDLKQKENAAIKFLKLPALSDVDKAKARAMLEHIKNRMQTYAQKSLTQLSEGLDFYFGRNGNKQNPEKAFARFLDAANMNLASAQNWVGICYARGYGVTQSKKEAMKWYLKAAEQDDVYAYGNIGEMYFLGEGVEQDYKQAYDWLIKGARGESGEPKRLLGDLFADGLGVNQNAETAIFWYEQAAACDDALSLLKLARICANQEKSASCSGKALDYYKKAIDAGCDGAQEELDRYADTLIIDPAEACGDSCVKTLDEAIKLAQNGNLDMQIKLAHAYKDGSNGATQNEDSARYWHDLAVKSGKVRAFLIFADAPQPTQSTITPPLQQKKPKKAKTVGPTLANTIAWIAAFIFCGILEVPIENVFSEAGIPILIRFAIIYIPLCAILRLFLRHK